MAASAELMVHSQEVTDISVLEGYFDNLPAAMALYEAASREDRTPDLRLLYANRAWLEAVNVARDAVFGRFFSELAPKDRAWLSMLRDVALGRREASVKESYSEEAGQHIHSEIYSPKPGQVITINADRTRFVKSAEELSEQEQKISDLFQFMPSGFCMLTLIYGDDGKLADIAFDMINTRFESMGGFRINSLLGKRLLEEYPEYDTSLLFGYFEEVDRSGDKTKFFFERSQSGVLHEVFCYSQGKNRVLCIINDMSGQFAALDELKQARATIEEQNRKNQDLVTLVSDMTTGFCIGKLVRDEQGNAVDMVFEMANAAFETLEGLTPGTLPGKRLFDVRETVPHFDKYVEAVEQRTKITFIKPVESAGLLLEAMCFSSRNDTLICIESDVTTRIRAMEELKEAYATIEAQNRKNLDLVTLVSDMSTGFCIGKLVRDERGNAVDMVFEMANVAFDTLEGFAPGTLPGKRLFEVRKTVPHFCKYVEAVEQRTKITFIKPIESTGLILEAMCFSSRNDTLICIESDVTARIRAMEELKEAYATIEAQNRKNLDLVTLVSDMSTGFCIGKLVRDERGNAVDMVFEMANVAFDTLEGFAPGTLPGKRLFEVRKTVPHFCKYVEAVEQRTKITFIKPIESTGLILEAMCFSSYDDTLICIENDVTERVEADRKLQNAYATIEQQNETILSGITYASRIQKDLLPKNSVFEDVFSDHSVLWSPRDIVGGDIYWIKRFKAGAVLCVCDCTGHGTPGALLTMLVASAFEAVVTESNCADTAQILWELEQRLVSVFGVLDEEQAGRGATDICNGCDLAILFIARDGNVTLSAGQTHVFVCDGERVEQIRGQRLYVGEGKIKNKEEVQTVNVPANPRNKFYIASDGLFDQMGGAPLRPFGYKKFKEIILDHHEKSLALVSDVIWETFEAYRGNEARRDDVELISFAL